MKWRGAYEYQVDVGFIARLLGHSDAQDEAPRQTRWCLWCRENLGRSRPGEAAGDRLTGLGGDSVTLDQINHMKPRLAVPDSDG